MASATDPAPKPQPTVAELRERLRDLLPVVRRRFQVESLALFGSRVRQQAEEDSDLDLLVTFSKTPGLIRFLQLETFLSAELGLTIDLVMRDALRPRIAEEVLSQAVPV